LKLHDFWGFIQKPFIKKTASGTNPHHLFLHCPHHQGFFAVTGINKYYLKKCIFKE